MVILRRSTKYMATVKSISHNLLASICGSDGELWTPDRGAKSGQTRFDKKP